MTLRMYASSITGHFGDSGVAFIAQIERDTLQATEGSQLSFDPASGEFSILSTMKITTKALETFLGGIKSDHLTPRVLDEVDAKGNRTFTLSFDLTDYFRDDIFRSGADATLAKMHASALSKYIQDIGSKMNERISDTSKTDLCKRCMAFVPNLPDHNFTNHGQITRESLDYPVERSLQVLAYF